MTNRRITEFMQELDRERIACGYTMARLALAANLKTNYLEAYRTGTAIPKLTTVIQLCEALGIKLPGVPQLSVSKPYQKVR